MTCAVNSIFDFAGVLKCTPSNQIIDVCKQVAKYTANLVVNNYISFGF